MLHLCLIAVDVDRVRQRLEGIERDADGQRDLKTGQTDAGDQAEVFEEEVCVLEEDEEGETDGHRENQPAFFGLLVGGLGDF